MAGPSRGRALPSLHDEGVAFVIGGGGAASLLRRLPQRRRGGLDVGVDVDLELGEVLVEHVNKRARLRVVGGSVGPCFARVEDGGLHPRQRGRHLETEQGIGVHRLVLELAGKRGVKEIRRQIDRTAITRFLAGLVAGRYDCA